MKERTYENRLSSMRMHFKPFFEKAFCDYAYTDTKVAERAYENHEQCLCKKYLWVVFHEF